MNNENFFLYTFVMDYCGGTYISQVETNNLKIACENWSQNPDTKAIYKLGVRGKEILIRQVAECEPTELTGIINVWFVSFLIYGKSAHINIIRTVK